MVTKPVVHVNQILWSAALATIAAQITIWQLVMKECSELMGL